MEPRHDRDSEFSVADLTNRFNAPSAVREEVVPMERVKFLVEEVCANLERSHINARWQNGYLARVLSEEDLGNGKYLIDRQRGKVSHITDLIHFVLGVEINLLGEDSKTLDLGQKVKKLLEFKFNLMENQSYNASLFRGENRPGEGREVASKVKCALGCVDELISLYVRAAPTERKSVEERIYLNRENLDKLDYWAKRTIYAIDRQRLELPANE